jgi:geranylgeranyl diphosphate synthase type II
LLSTIAQSVGVPTGIVAGQAWECEPEVDLSAYHRSKTGALFVAATVAGAAAAGAEPAAWRLLGERLGEAVQVADDIRDVAGTAAELGKPVGRDQALGRPSSALALGVSGALQRLESLVAEAVAAIPRCAGQSDLRRQIRIEAERLLPASLALRAA